MCCARGRARAGMVRAVLPAMRAPSPPCSATMAARRWSLRWAEGGGRALRHAARRHRRRRAHQLRAERHALRHAAQGGAGCRLLCLCGAGESLEGDAGGSRPCAAPVNYGPGTARRRRAAPQQGEPGPRLVTAVVVFAGPQGMAGYPRSACAGAGNSARLRSIRYRRADGLHHLRLRRLPRPSPASAWPKRLFLRKQGGGLRPPGALRLPFEAGHKSAIS